MRDTDTCRIRHIMLLSQYQDNIAMLIYLALWRISGIFSAKEDILNNINNKEGIK